MKKLPTFIAGLLGILFLIYSLPYSKNKVTQLRLENLWAQEVFQIKKQLIPHCGSLKANPQTSWSQFFDSWIDFNAVPNGAECFFQVQVAQDHRFHLIEKTALTLYVHNKKGESLAVQSFQVQFPTPYAVFPLFAFILAVFLQVSFWNLSLSLGLFVLFLNGGNLLQLLSEIPINLQRTLEADRSVFGLILIFFWVALNLSPKNHLREGKVETNLKERFINRWLSFFIGFWSPMVYTILGRPLLTRWGRLAYNFLDTQFVVLSLSLCFLNFSLFDIRGSIGQSVLLPRYFTLAVLCVFLMRRLIEDQEKRYHLIWKLPFFTRTLIGIGLVEILSRYVPELASFPFLTRVGFASVMSVVIWPSEIQWKETFKLFLPWAGAALLSLYLAVYCHQSGLFDLILVVLDPRKHPLVLSFFSFLCGLFLGFITGNFSAVYFSFYAAMKSPQLPLVHAAILDGVLAGVLFSPFSFFNLVPSFQFKMAPSDLFRFRVKQLGIPLLIGWLIYAVGTIHSIAILRPVTFVFACMVFFAFQLRSQDWKIRKSPLFGD